MKTKNEDSTSFKKLKIHATGCCLVDKIYRSIDFSSPGFLPVLPQKTGDGGLSPGGLVFKNDLEEHIGKTIETLLKEIMPEEQIPDLNIGGPAIVALMTAALLTSSDMIETAFFQQYGDDSNGLFLKKTIEKTVPSLSLEHYTCSNGATAETLVLSDPAFNEGQGERCFINTIGTAAGYSRESLGDDFFNADILLFGGTALTPGIHKDLKSLINKAQNMNCLTIINTVYDFLSEKKHAGKRWPLGDLDTLESLDLLICDHLEALKISGTDNTEKAIAQFKEWGLSALIITHGAESVTFYADPESLRFKPAALESYPVCQLEGDIRLSAGDTTGCGDNFVGGVVSSLAEQLSNGSKRINLSDAVLKGIYSGASSCFHSGGIMKESTPGEKVKLIEEMNFLHKRQNPLLYMENICP